jgi:hypothetical protein
MSLMNRILGTARLWQLILPDVPHPTPAWIARWCDDFSDVAIEQAIVRTSKKFRVGQVLPAPEEVWKYCGGVAANITRAGRPTEKVLTDAAELSPTDDLSLTGTEHHHATAVSEGEAS